MCSAHQFVRQLLGRILTQHLAHERVVGSQIPPNHGERQCQLNSFQILINRGRSRQLLLHVDQCLIRIPGQAFPVGLSALGGSPHQCDCIAKQTRSEGAAVQQTVAHKELRTHLLNLCDLVPSREIRGQLRVRCRGGAQVLLFLYLGAKELRIE